MSKPKYNSRYHDFDVLSIIGDKVSGERNSRMALSFRNGSPRIVVYTGATGAGSVLQHGFSNTSFRAFCNRVLELTEAPNGTKNHIQLTSEIWENNQPTGKFKIGGTLHFGKSKEGMMYFSLIEEGKTKIVFPVKQRPTEKWFEEDGEPTPDSVMSVRMTKALFELMKESASAVLKTASEERVDHAGFELGEIKPFGTQQTKPKQPTVAVPKDDSSKEIFDDLEGMI